MAVRWRRLLSAVADARLSREAPLRSSNQGLPLVVDCDTLDQRAQTLAITRPGERAAAVADSRDPDAKG
jgi:hypothetical protein